MALNPLLSLRSSTGVEVWKTSGSRKPYVQDESFKRDESKNCRAIAWSGDGQYLAWANGGSVELFAINSWSRIATLPRPKTFFIKFSPLSTYLMTWELFTTSPANPDGSPNLHIYKTATGEMVYSAVQKRQADWQPHWSHDEKICALMLGGEAYFFELDEGTSGFAKAAKKLGGGRNGGISLSPGATPHVGFYVPGVKGAPSMVKVYRYPNLDGQPVASKSFFQADRVEMMWNNKGTGMLILSSTEVDNTGVSYYGKSALHFVNTKGDSFAVQLDSDGPIHSIAWSPKSTEFCVVYGFMPAKAALFNLKCDRVHDFGTGPRNSIYFNAFGNLVLFGGFGNLRGNIEIFDTKTKSLVSTSQAPDTTQLEWSPNGDTYVTATCAPRLRIGNGFKIWHYSGALLHETHWPEKQELWEIAWQNFPAETFKEPVISTEKIEGIQSSQAQASTQKYVPPCIRDNLTPAATANGERYIPGLPPGYRSSKANDAGKKRNSNQQRRPNTRKSGADINGKSENANGEAQQTPKQTSKPRPKTAPANHSESGTEGTPKIERDPKIAKIHKKLREIRNLKEKQGKGEKLDGNQTAKLNAESDLVKELSELKLIDNNRRKAAAAPAQE